MSKYEHDYSWQFMYHYCDYCSCDVIGTELECEYCPKLREAMKYSEERQFKIEKLQSENKDLRECLDKIRDPTKREHREPDTYTQLGCVMNMADECLNEIDKDKQ